MGLNVTQKILKEHLVDGKLVPGEEIAIRIDQALTQDATGTMAYLQFEAMGLNRVRADLAVSYVDHNTVQIGPENADDHRFLRSAAAKFGAIFSKPGNGICHQLHLERFGVPGATLLGSDSHTPTGGGLGMLAIGAGGIDVAVALGGGPFHLACPRVVRIELTGRLPEWTSAKDVILEVLRRFTTRGNVGLVFEYGGPGLEYLDVPERATITNMGAECGVTTSVFPSDGRTRAFLDAQGRGGVWREITADPDAVYEQTVEIDLTQLEPLAATPHSPGNVEKVATLAGLKVDQVMIGSCTNSSYRDLKTVALILDGHKVHSDVDLCIAPGSRQVVAMLAREGLMEKLLGAGVRLMENACGFCIGNSASPATEAVSLRTSNRNFEGRSGTQSAGVYLVSPETAALAALAGKIVYGPGQREIACPRVELPESFIIDDSMFIYPPENGGDVEILRGPNIGTVPRKAPPGNSLSGVATLKVGDKITTDHIMPAGPRLKYRSNVKTYAQYVFEHVDPEFSARAAANRDAGKGNFIIAGESYGQGSSREHAALCPMFLGVVAVIAKSIERIHFANLINFGIIPFNFATKDGYDQIERDDVLRVDGLKEIILGDGRGMVVNVTRNIEIPVTIRLSDRQRKILLAGGLLNMWGA